MKWKNWIGLFLALNLLFPSVGNTNPYSRLALIFSILEDGSFSIDRYKNLTIDWAEAENRRFYSNKAPAPSLIAIPFAWILDKAVTWGASSREERDAARFKALDLYQSVLSFLLQVIPYAVIVFAVLAYLNALGVSALALQLAAVALLFGNTASLLMNSFYGHGFAATMVLGAVYFSWREKFFWSGFLAGLAVLSDYLCVLFLIPFLLIHWRKGFNIVVGGLFPLAIWVFYHTSAFGSPFRTALQYENPAFRDATSAAFGTLSLPRLSIIRELLFGKMRGLIWGMPWAFVVVVAVACLTAKKRVSVPLRKMTILMVLSFPLWVLANAGFNAWHAGQCPGPRYLSPVLPLFAVWLALSFDEWKPYMKWVAAGGVGVSVLLFIAFFAADANISDVFKEMPDYYGGLFPRFPSRHFVREVGIFALFGFTLFTTGLFYSGNNSPNDR